MDKRVSKYISLLFVILAFIFSLISVIAAFNLRSLRLDYLNDEKVYRERFSIKMRDGKILFGLLYADPSDLKKNDSSVPSILMLNGINSKKEDHFEEAFQLVKFGYAVFSVEQRGHGESKGPSGFLSKEPYDMVEVLDYISLNYEFVNNTHFGLLGFSYGGGIGAILQAIDERIHTSVLYHPLTAIEELTEQIPFQNLVGSTLSVKNIDEISDAFDIANRNNTKNMLLIHGLEDILIFPESSQMFYSYLDGEKRKDIDLLLRPGLDHGNNEKDEVSLKHTLIWFEKFLKNATINHLDRDNLIEQIELFQLGYPNNFHSEIFSVIAILFLFTGLSVFLLNNKIIPKWKQRPFEENLPKCENPSEVYLKMIKYRTIIYILPVFIIGPIFMVLNRSFIYSYFIIYPLVTSVLLLFIPSEYHQSWKDEWKKWVKYDSYSFLSSLVIVIFSFGIFLTLFNLNAILMQKALIPFFNNSLLQYLLLGFGSITMDLLYLREFKQIHVFLLLLLRPLSVILFIFFVQLPPFPLLGGLNTHIIFIILTGAFLYYMRQLIVLLSKFYKTVYALTTLIMIPLIMLFSYIFFRII
ncbi:MAG: Alpha/beta hydrolase family protein [Promethearchaeota archaeon]|nr:MAG: Alpha/beta hydrolase family protein [Candidatus Lokiarchaeota archaeon]